ncbi:hypothetical protein AUP68_07923 [Ilyonectria robusta]
MIPKLPARSDTIDCGNGLTTGFADASALTANRPPVQISTLREDNSEKLMGSAEFAFKGVLVCLPWVIGMILSWLPLTKISLDEASAAVQVYPTSNLLNTAYPFYSLASLIPSSIELGGILLLGAAYRYLSILYPPLAAATRPGIFGFWFILIALEPVAMGCYIFTHGMSLECESDSTSADCKVGQGLFVMIGIYRALGT